MSAFLTYEGTTDYLAVTPAMVITLAASGSIIAGRAVVVESTNPGYCYMPTGAPSGSLTPAGVATATVSDGDPIGVIVWGYVKSLPSLPATGTVRFGQPLVITGSGYWGTSGSTKVAQVAGKTVSGSAGYTYAFIDCMDNVA
jgi:hypothetical protein